MILLQISSNTYFTYDNYESYLHGLRFAWIEESPETNLVSEKSYARIKNASRNFFRVARTGYDEPLSFAAEIISDRVLSDAEVRRVYSKFFNKNQYCELVVSQTNGENIHFNAIMTDIEKEEGGYGNEYGVVGFRLTIVCDAPWGWTKEKIVVPEYELDNYGNGTFFIRNRSDSQDYLYPEVEIILDNALDTPAMTCSKIGNKHSCYGCVMFPKCIQNRNLPPSVPSEISEQTVFVNNTPVKGMIINKTDNILRGTCFLARNDYSQKIIMNPVTGIINGYNGTTVTDPNTGKEEFEITGEIMPKVSQTNKKFIRLVPGDNEFLVENICGGRITMRYREAKILV